MPFDDSIFAPATCSNVMDDKNWVIDLDTSERNMTKVCHLDRYCIKQLILPLLRNNPLVLVNLVNNKKDYLRECGQGTQHSELRNQAYCGL